MNNYEHTFITKTDLTQDAFTKLLDKYSKKIEEHGGEIVKTEKWGIINFSSKIKQYKKGKYIHIKFKGSGQTPYARGADGKAVLGPMLREYIISEAMHALNIPTTRSLAVVTTGENVFRENKNVSLVCCSIWFANSKHVIVRDVLNHG